MEAQLKERIVQWQERFAQMRLVPFGGPRDAAAVIAGAAGMAFTSPFFVGASSLLPFGLGAAASSALLSRLFEDTDAPQALASALRVVSAPLPRATDSDGILMGYTTDRAEAFRLPQEDLVRHILMVGQSGVGKTVAASTAMFQHIQGGGGVGFLDGKVDRENIQNFAMMAAAAGRLDDLIIINPLDPSNTNTYNMILDGDPDEVSARFSLMIPSTESNAGADYYKQATNQGITTVVAALQAARLAYTFTDLGIILTNPRAAEHLLQVCKTRAPAHDAVRNLNLFLEQYRTPGKDGTAVIDMKKVKDTFGGIAGRSFLFGFDKFGAVTNSYTPDLRMFDAMCSNKLIYIALPTMAKDQTAMNFGKITVADIRTAVAWIQLLPVHLRPSPAFLWFFDEAGSYATAAWARLFEQARSANVALWPAIQTLANFTAVSEELSEMIKGNTWCKVFFKTGTQATSEELAELIGYLPRAQRSVSDSLGSSISNPHFEAAPLLTGGRSGSMGVTEREELVHRVSVDDLKALDKGECLLTYGNTKLYNLRIPLLKFGRALRTEVGEFQVRRFKHPPAEGINLFAQADRFVTPDC